MRLFRLYDAVSSLLRGIDFGALWPGFHRFGFALYDDFVVQLGEREFPADERFLGNTAIWFEQEWIAIWKVEGDPDAEEPEELASGLAHEMFHAFQREKGETRYPNDLWLLDYPDDAANFLQRLEENRYLAQSPESMEAFSAFFALRRARSDHLGDIAEQEFRVETVEGLAECVGMQALLQINAGKYAARLRQYKHIVAEPDKGQLDIRRTGYFTGALFFLAARAHGIVLDADLSCRNTFFRQVNGSFPLPAAETLLSGDADRLLRALSGRRERKEVAIREFLAEKTEEVAYPSRLCGYDPMNMVKCGDALLCTHFAMLQKKDAEPLLLRRPVLLRMRAGERDRVEAYVLRTESGQAGHAAR